MLFVLWYIISIYNNILLFLIINNFKKGYQALITAESILLFFLTGLLHHVKDCGAAAPRRRGGTEVRALLTNVFIIYILVIISRKDSIYLL